jgi:hypothetical protein
MSHNQGADLLRPWSCSTCLGRSPPSVLGGIQLSSLPWSGAGASTTTFGLALHGSAVSPRVHRSRDHSVIAHSEAGTVSVPSPTVSGCASQRHASCSEGGTSPGGPRGPPADSRLSSTVVSCFSLYSGKNSRKNSLSRSRISSSESALLYSSSGSALSVRKVGPHL